MEGSEGKKNGKVDKSNDEKRKRKRGSVLNASLDAEELAEWREEHENRGVLYVSRLPPRFGPNQLRALLSRHADILRIFLEPINNDESSERELLQKKSGKGKRSSRERLHKRASFAHGWVECAKKKDAKRIAELLNNTPMGGNRRRAHHDDLWNLKYLKGFRWNDLSEELAQKKRERTHKLRRELAQATRERDFFLERMDQAKALESIRERKRLKAEASHNDTNTQSEQISVSKARTFVQRKASEHLNNSATQHSESKVDLDPDLLNSIFR
mmetsp:Transcript_10242/g.18446  ORF Transcript_10242/g.18446 Transcript_10242/m.18446 type:complete len:271 (-) Transcript_10242:450-1262(-)